MVVLADTLSSTRLRLAAVGLALGLLVAGASSRIVAGILYQVSATDPVAFVGAPVFLLLVAAGTCLLPALRASRTHPVEAFRAD